MVSEYCNGSLDFGDEYDGTGFSCDLEKGHAGPHMNSGDIEGPNYLNVQWRKNYTITWTVEVVR